MSVHVARSIIDLLADHPSRCALCNKLRPRQATPATTWAAVMAAPDPWGSEKLAELIEVFAEPVTL